MCLWINSLEATQPIQGFGPKYPEQYTLVQKGFCLALSALFTSRIVYDNGSSYIFTTLCPNIKPLFIVSFSQIVLNPSAVMLEDLKNQYLWLEYLKSQ